MLLLFLDGEPSTGGNAANKEDLEHAPEHKARLYM